MEGFTYLPCKGRNAAPQVDFGATPVQQLGLVPRAVFALFDALGRQADRRVTVRCVRRGTGDGGEGAEGGRC